MIQQTEVVTSIGDVSEVIAKIGQAQWGSVNFWKEITFRIMQSVCLNHFYWLILPRAYCCYRAIF